MINHPADNFDDPQVLLRPKKYALRMPQFSGNKMVYLERNLFAHDLYKVKSGIAQKLNTQNFDPYLMANLNNQLLFASLDTGSTQLYLRLDTGEIQRISDMQPTGFIEHIAVKGNIVVLSYANQVVIYEYQNNQLVLLKTLPNYSHGVISADGTKLLLTKASSENTTTVIEKHFNTFKSTGREVKKVICAFYHGNKIVYLDDKEQLFRIDGEHLNRIATKVVVKELKHIDIADDHFYYIARDTTQNQLFKVNFITGSKRKVDIGSINPSRIEVINDELYIRANRVVFPSIVTSELISK